MILFILLACLIAKRNKHRVAPVFKDVSLYPFFAVECVYWVFQGFAFSGDYRFLPYSGYLQSAYIVSMLFPILKHKLYARAILGAGMVAAGTALNRLVMSANGGRMPVYPTLSRLRVLRPQGARKWARRGACADGLRYGAQFPGGLRRYRIQHHEPRRPAHPRLHRRDLLRRHQNPEQKRQRGRLNLDGLMVFIAEGLLGYLLQCVACIIGICSVAKKRVKWLPVLATSIVFAVIVYLVRTVGKFNFGVHTMLIILIENLICILIFKVDVRFTILGSLMVTIIVLAGEMINYSLLMIFFD
jgi:hypothetical protein